MFGPRIQYQVINGEREEKKLGCCNLHPINIMKNPIHCAKSSKNLAAKLNLRHCMQKFKTEILEQKSFTIDSGNKFTSGPKFQIKFGLSCRSIYRDMIANLDFGLNSPQLERVGQGYYFQKWIDFNVWELPSEKAFKSLAEEIKDWPLWDSARTEFINFVLMKAWDVVNCMPFHHNTIYLRFITNIYHDHVYEVEHVSGDCSICLEEFKFSEVRRLRCSHIFHRDCITKWLKKAKVSSCPLCRSRIYQTS